MSTSAEPQTAIATRASFWRRIGAILYDILIVAALLMAATGLALAVTVALTASGMVTIAADGDHAALLASNGLFTLYLVAVVVWFYVGFWTRGGQTLGMRTWRLRVQNTDGSPISHKQALLRLACSLFGLGNLWALGQQRLALQDKYAQCEVVVLSGSANEFRQLRK